MNTYGGGPTVPCEECGEEIEFGIGGNYSSAMVRYLDSDRFFFCNDCPRCSDCGSKKLYSKSVDERICPFCENHD